MDRIKTTFCFVFNSFTCGQNGLVMVGFCKVSAETYRKRFPCVKPAMKWSWVARYLPYP